ncbi:MAG: AhpC/TSA family protein [Spirulinaceae cyanobacterium SM2_1_0]|nr:AhpC/TSA family protein [Spirulinaceae cyanobacterium SM2_1_0]
MNLTQELADLHRQIEAKLPEEIKTTMQAAARDLIESGIATQSVNVGDRAPHFALPNATGTTVDLQALLAQGPVVIAFYRGQWCPYCNLQLRALQQALPEIQQLGATLVAISPQTPDNSLSTVEKHTLEFEVLSDVGNRVARDFGLVFQLPTELCAVYDSLGLDLPAHNGDDSFELPLAATYILAPDGVVTRAHVQPDYKQRLAPEEIIAALQELTVAA